MNDLSYRFLSLTHKDEDRTLFGSSNVISWQWSTALFYDVNDLLETVLHFPAESNQLPSLIKSRTKEIRL